ncbi:MAG: hypothetical protein V1913_06300 [Fibrobacterota bacterium]
MKTISLHGIDNALNDHIREHATAMGLSVNKTVKSLLEKSLGMAKETGQKGLFDDLCGVWSKKEEQEFRKKTKGFEKIDPADWKK